MRPQDLPAVSILAEGKPHGTRIRYMAGCKCVPCRAANSRYETQRLAARKRGDWNGLVDARRTKRHLRRLSRAGIGRHSVAILSGIGKTVIQQVTSGTKTRIRARTERSILEVSKHAFRGGHVIPSGPTWTKIQRLLREGFTKRELARRLGYANSIQFNRERITVRNAKKVERFYRKITAI